MTGCPFHFILPAGGGIHINSILTFISHINARQITLKMLRFSHSHK